MIDDSTELGEAHVPQPATAIASHLVRADKADEYFEAQTAISDVKLPHWRISRVSGWPLPASLLRPSSAEGRTTFRGLDARTPALPICTVTRAPFSSERMIRSVTIVSGSIPRSVSAIGRRAKAERGGFTKFGRSRKIRVAGQGRRTHQGRIPADRNCSRQATRRFPNSKIFAYG